MFQTAFEQNIHNFSKCSKVKYRFVFKESSAVITVYFNFLFFLFLLLLNMDTVKLTNPVLRDNLYYAFRKVLLKFREDGAKQCVFG